MSIKVTIETWNDEWHFEIEDKETGEALNAGYYPTYKQCVSECTRYLAQLAAAQQSAQTKGFQPPHGHVFIGGKCECGEEVPLPPFARR